MKTTFLALVLAAAAMPLTFAAQASGQATPPASGTTKPAATTTKNHKKKASKKVKKAATDKAAVSHAVPAAPVAPVKK